MQHHCSLLHRHLLSSLIQRVASPALQGPTPTFILGPYHQDCSTSFTNVLSGHNLLPCLFIYLLKNYLKKKNLFIEHILLY